MDSIAKAGKKQTQGGEMPPKPVTFPSDLTRLPAVFTPYKALPVWVLWRWVQKEDGEWTKPPFQVNGRKARNNDPATWSTYDEVLAAFQRGVGDGIGLCLAGVKELTVFDLDDCRDAGTGEMAPWAREVIDEANSYTEVTPSGEGYRVIGTGSVGSVQKRFNGLPDGGGIEVYADTNRYVCVTGAQVPGCWPQIADIGTVTRKLLAFKGRLKPESEQADILGGESATGKKEARGEPEEREDGEEAEGLGADAGGDPLEDVEDGKLLRLIRDGAPKGERSEAFFHACGRAKDSGWSEAQTEDVMRQYPNGVAAKYLAPVDRLREEIARAWKKTENKARRDDLAGFDVHAPGEEVKGEDKPKKAKSGFILNTKGKPAPIVANVTIMLRSKPAWAGVIALDRFASREMLLRPVPDVTGRKPNAFEPRPLEDGDIIRATEWFQHNGFAGMKKEAVADGLSLMAKDCGFDPLEDKLRSLKWDGVPRIARWLLDYCGAEPDETQSEAYIMAAGMRWLISAVARALRPGCKVDTAIVLGGPQGIGKSRAGRVLAYHDEWFSDCLPDIHSKEAADHLRGRWIIEFGEMATASRADMEVFKAFMTRQLEKFRPPYGRKEVEYARRCVFFGTSNKDEFLRDDTGNRRFWPIRVTAIDIARLEADRDQLWAEAVHMFDNGVQWHLTEEEAEAAAIQQDAFLVRDERIELLEEKLGRRRSTTVMAALALMEMKTEKKEQMEMASMLRSLGWTRRSDGRRKYWAAPPTTSFFNGENFDD